VADTILSTGTIKKLKSLALKKYRLERGEFLIEGKRLITEALETKQTILNGYFTSAFQSSEGGESLINRLKLVASATLVTEKEMKHISPTETPPGIIAVCPLSRRSEPFPGLKSANWLFLDGIRDPGNLGTLLRTAVWFGVKAVALSADCVDPFNPKTLRSGMGAHFHLQFLGPLPLEYFTSSHQILGADHRGTAIQTLENVLKPWVLAAGNEAHGLSPSTRTSVNQLVSVPKHGQGESLNVGVATGIILYHLTA